jgi:hypothetical protein
VPDNKKSPGAMVDIAQAMARGLLPWMVATKNPPKRVFIESGVVPVQACWQRIHVEHAFPSSGSTCG